MSREELQTLLESLAAPTTPVTAPPMSAPAASVATPPVHQPAPPARQPGLTASSPAPPTRPRHAPTTASPTTTMPSAPHGSAAGHPSGSRAQGQSFTQGQGAPYGPVTQETRTGLTCDVRVLARPFGASGVVPVTVRLAGPADVDAVAWLNTRVWQETSKSVASSPAELEFETSRTAQHLSKALRGNKERTHGIDLYEYGGRLVVAEGDGELIGYAWCGPGREPDPVRLVEVYSMQVAKAFHGTGVARAVLAMALEGHPAYLWVGRTNCRGQAFYAGLGFKTRDDNDPTRDLVCMFR